MSTHLTPAMTSIQTDNSSSASISNHKKIVIAIDGPSASGKGTLARKMAERLGYAYLETGALYRAVGLAALEMAADLDSESEIEPALNCIWRNLTPELLANPELRTERVAQAASKVAAMPSVRQKLLDYQRQFASNPPGNVGGAVLDGRDIGTAICPDADVKLFVTASIEERARRRYQEVKHTATTLDDVLSDMKERDLRDRSRLTAPTRAAADAYIIDTTTITPDEVLEESIAVVRSKFLAESAPE